MGQSGGLDSEGNELPRLVYVSREKRPGFQHHKKAGAMNALVSAALFFYPECYPMILNQTLTGPQVSHRSVCQRSSPMALSC